MPTYRVLKKVEDEDSGPAIWDDLGEIETEKSWMDPQELGDLEGAGTYLAWGVGSYDMPKEYVVLATTPRYEFKEDEL